MHGARGIETAGASPCLESANVAPIDRLAEIALPRHYPVSYRFDNAPWGAGLAVPGPGGTAPGSVYRDLDPMGGCWRP